MRKVLVIGRRNVGEKNDAFQLAQAVGRTKALEVEGAYFEDLVVTSQVGGSDVLLHRSDDFVPLDTFTHVILINWSHDRLYTDLAHSVAYVAARKGLTVWNKELLHARSSTKVSQVVRLSYEDVSLPKTVFSLTSRLLKGHISSLGAPFVAKDPLASRGRRNHLCKSWDDFTQQAQAVPYTLQQFIPNDASDMRLFIAGGQSALAILRKGSGDSHLNNISQGATAELVPLGDLPQELLEAAAKVAGHFQRDLCGIDFMKNTDTGEYVFLEINTTPQIVNGAFAEEKAAAIAQALMR